MLPYQLEEPIKGSWEELLGTLTKTNVYFFTKAFNPNNLVKAQRFVGYGPKAV
ncbi:hypothetical protein [Pedobacter zeae]|uniref:Uncharacterized protein n=1 Tax=Pedobacter zeae TaxID=1737356 RepID=A0A7W6K915_9SPHI|nr:hypothetical protein [Pedobacter zeae]MBB4107460.1 hypothetical protein [Pedobacter zeae]GGG99188.1 hypothetical protein GCM10007422_11870 [Pedobacter zeae]